MGKFVTFEIKKVILPFLFVTIVFTTINIIIAILIKDNYVFYHKVELWEESNQVFNFIFAALVSMPLCWIVYFERKDNYIVYTLPRISRKKYIITKWIITALTGGMIAFLISAIGLFVCLYLIEPITVISNENDYTELNHFLGYYFVHKPLQYGLLLSVWRAFIGGVLSTMGYLLSLYENNIFIILTGPFIFTLLESFVLANLGTPEYNFFTLIEPASLVKGSTTPFTFFIGIMIVFIAIGGLLLYYKSIKKENIYHI